MNKGYTRIDESSVPQDTVFCTLGRDQGQTIEVSYSMDGQRSEPVPGEARYRKVHDRSDGEIAYYKLS